jgi:hypothetical protein
MLCQLPACCCCKLKTISNRGQLTYSTAKVSVEEFLKSRIFNTALQFYKSNFNAHCHM